MQISLSHDIVKLCDTVNNQSEKNLNRYCRERSGHNNQEFRRCIDCNVITLNRFNHLYLAGITRRMQHRD